MQVANTLNGFKNRTALLYIEATKSNYSVASGDASRLFTDIRDFTDQSKDKALNQNLESVLGSRDAIIGGLARADASVTQKIQEMFLAMQKMQPSGASAK